jgi:putative ABC transport system ATP-binding protein
VTLMNEAAQLIFDLQQVNLSRSGEKVLTDVSFSLRQGESLVIIGPSGSGKSSLLRCLNRLEPIQSGRILFLEVDTRQLPTLELRRRIGMVFQKAAVFPGTVSDNIAYGPRLQGKTLSRSAVLDLMQQAALEPELIDRDAQELSGGQEQRLALARALANQPDVLLLDEATTALDPIATYKIEQALHNLRLKKGLTLIWVSHSIEQVRRVADRVLLLENGQVTRHDTVTALLDTEIGDTHTLAFANGIEEP